MESTDNDADEEALIPDVNGADADLWAQPLIEYWIWNGMRLIPASADQADRLREIEAFRRLALWQDKQERARRREKWRQRWIALVANLPPHGAALQRGLSGAANKPRQETPSARSNRTRNREVPRGRRSGQAR